MNRLLLFFLMLFLTFSDFASDLKGFVKETKTGEPLPGASVYLKNTSIGTLSGLDGSYTLKGITPAKYTLVISFLGYGTVEKEVVINDQTVIMNFELEEGSNQLKEIVVKGIGDRESEISALRSEQKADNVLNILGAKTIQLLPDITVGNLLQRVSGVSMVRNGSGDGQYAIIRGMDKRYNYTLVNGIKIPSPDNKNRYIPMDIFPSDLLERLEVVKALTPNMEGDAIGGAMNMIMKSAPDYLTISASAATGYSTLFSDRPFSGFDRDVNQNKAPSEIHGNGYAATPSDFSNKSLLYHDAKPAVNSLFSLSIGDRIFNHKLGVFVGGSYQHTYRGNNTTYFSPNGQPSPDPQPNTPVFDAIQKRQYSNEQARTGANLKLDYAFNRSNKIGLLGLFMQLDDYQHRNIYSNTLTMVGDVGISDRSVFRRQNIYNATLQGDHSLTEKLIMKWSAVTSLATSKTPNWTDLSTTYNTTTDVEGHPITSVTYIDGVAHTWTHNEDQDYTGYLNFEYAASDALEFMAGAMYRDKHRSNYYNSYSLSTVLPSGARQVYTGIENAQLSFRPTSYAYADSTNANNYTADEQITAGYVQSKYNLSRLQILGGVRIEQTNQAYVSQLPVTATSKTGTIQYLDVLPSLHFKYTLSAQQNLRLSYFKGISRPGFFEIVPASFPGDYFTESGNYNIKHTTADNVDLRYEIFPGGGDRLFIGAFYKNIHDPIEYGFNIINQTVTVYSPQNFGRATNFGVELVFAKYFKNFGISGNYTYTNSQITTSKRVYGRDANGYIVNTLENQTRPLQGQSDHIANLSLIYKNQKLGWDVQLTGVYTGKRINVVSPYKDLDYWQRGTSQVDFSTDKKIGKRFSVFLKATNLLNNPIIVEILHDNNVGNLPEQTRGDRILVQKDVFQQSFLLGVRFKY